MAMASIWRRRKDKADKHGHTVSRSRRPTDTLRSRAPTQSLDGQRISPDTEHRCHTDGIYSNHRHALHGTMRALKEVKEGKRDAA